MGAERSFRSLLAMLAAMILVPNSTGCSWSGDPSPAASSRSPTSTIDQAASHATERDSIDPSCAAPGRVKFADLPQVLRAVVKGQQSWRWFGARNIWVSAPPVSNIPNSLRVKFGSVTLDEDGEFSDSAGPPTVTAQQVDGSGTVEGHFGGYASIGAKPTFYFWPTTIDFPTPGCWLITETFQDTTLRFLMSVRG